MYEDIKFDKWENSIHSTPDQRQRIEDSKCINPDIVDYKNKCAVFTENDNTYETTLDSCTCSDFQARNLPCKHIYNLVAELGEFNYCNSDNSKDEGDNNIDEQTPVSPKNNITIPCIIIALSFVLFCAIFMPYKAKYNNLMNDYNDLTGKLYGLRDQKAALEKKIDELEALTVATTELIPETTTETTTIATTTTTIEITTTSEAVNNTPVYSENNNSSSDFSSSSGSYRRTGTTGGSTVYIGQTGTKYHKQDCQSLKGKGTAISLSEAQAQGREPCGICYR